MPSRSLDDLLPEAKALFEEFEKRLAERGLSFKRSCTYRSQMEQNALFMRGRRPLAEVNAAYKRAGMAPITEAENKRSVTWRTVSNHTGREAVDYYQALDGKASYDLKVDVDRDHIPDWEEFGRTAEDCGLVWGGRWKPPDYAHVEMRG